MLASLEKLIGIVGTPVAVIYGIGFLAQVANLWLVEKAHDFSFLTAWHAANLIDRAVVVGIGLKYWVFSLLIAVPIVLMLRKLSGSISTGNTTTMGDTTTTGDTAPITGGTASTTDSTASTAGDTAPTTGGPASTSGLTRVERWIRFTLISFLIALPLLFLWLPLHALGCRQVDMAEISVPNVVCGKPYGVVTYLPDVEMSVPASVVTNSESADTNGQTFVGVARPDENEDGNEYTVTGTIEPSVVETQSQQDVEPVRAVLLSHDTEYWYVFSEEDGKILSIPVDQASEIRVTP